MCHVVPSWSLVQFRSLNLGPLCNLRSLISPQWRVAGVTPAMTSLQSETCQLSCSNQCLAVLITSCSCQAFKLVGITFTYFKDYSYKSAFFSFASLLRLLSVWIFHQLESPGLISSDWWNCPAWLIRFPLLLTTVPFFFKTLLSSPRPCRNI